MGWQWRKAKHSDFDYQKTRNDDESGRSGVLAVAFLLVLAAVLVAVALDLG